MSCSIPNLLMSLKKLVKCGWILVWNLYKITHVLKFQTCSGIFNLILHYHVVHDRTTCHHLPQGLRIPLFRRFMNNCKTRTVGCLTEQGGMLPHNNSWVTMMGAPPGITTSLESGRSIIRWLLVTFVDQTSGLSWRLKPDSSRALRPWGI